MASARQLYDSVASDKPGIVFSLTNKPLKNIIVNSEFTRHLCLKIYPVQ